MAVAISLLVGFLGGIFFSAFKLGPVSSSHQHTPTQQQVQQGLSPDDAAKILELEKEVAVNPENYEALVELGHRYFDSGQHQKAINMYVKALALDSSDANVWTDLGVMYRRSKQPQKALESFETASTKNPKHEISRFNKGIVLFYDMKDYKGAIAAWNDLLTINPNAKAGNGIPVSEFIKEAEKQLNQ